MTSTATPARSVSSSLRSWRLRRRASTRRDCRARVGPRIRCPHPCFCHGFCRPAAVVFELMFDEEWDPGAAAYYDRQAALLDLIDERDVVGALPEGPFVLEPPARSDAEMCAAVATRVTRLRPGVLARLDGVDIEALAGVSAVDAAVAFDRVANRVAARRVRAVATAVRRQLGTERVDPIQLASAELAERASGREVLMSETAVAHLDSERVSLRRKKSFIFARPKGVPDDLTVFVATPAA